jgi:ABC-type transport system involved in cytochrome c biogenesis ATPase subunit
MIKINNLKICFEALSITYPEINANKGDFVAIYGKAGSGKSTLFNIILNFIKPSFGEIFLNGLKNTDQNIFSSIHYISQFPDENLIGLTVLDDLNLWRKDIEMSNILEEFSLNKIQNIPIFNLSFGQKKALAFAALKLSQKSIWLIDEPFTGLSDNIKKQLTKLFQNFIQTNGLIIVTSCEEGEFTNLSNKEFYL